MRILFTIVVILISFLFVDYTSLAARQQQNTEADTTAGIIAYSNGPEIRIVSPDGSNNQVVWTVPDNIFSVQKLAWSPDGREIAFTSDHESSTSLYQQDIYSIRPNGTGFRKLTNPPLYEELASYAKGSVTVSLTNYMVGNSGPFTVYIRGAQEPQQVFVSYGASKTLVFDDVADLGDDVFQHVVVIQGTYRWLDAAAAADVKPGTTADAGSISMTNALENYAAEGPFWRSDGSQIGFCKTFGYEGILSCNVEQVPVTPTLHYHYDPVFDPDLYGNPFVVAWAPLPALADQLLVTDNARYWDEGEIDIYRTTEGSQDEGELIVTLNDYVDVFDIRWLPDGTGFMLARHDNLIDRGINIYEYHFGEDQPIRITEFANENEGVRSFSISPDGQFVVFEYGEDFYSDKRDIWVMRRDGTDSRLLVEQGTSPHWGVQSQQESQPPVADAGKDTTLTADENGVALLTLDGTASSDADGDIVRYTWSKGQETLAEGAQAEVELPVGEHEITLEVEDNEGLTATDLLVVVVREQAQNNEPPVAHAGEDQAIEAGEDGVAEVTLDGSASSDADGNIESYTWSEGEEQIGEGIQAVVELSVGQHQIMLTIVDDQGASATDEVFITIQGPSSEEIGVWLEAECADTIGTHWVQREDATASEGAYISLQEGLSSPDSPPAGVSAKVTYHFEITQTGAYHIFGRVKANGTADNAFWVRLNEGDWMQWPISSSGSAFDWIILQNEAFALETERTQKLEVAYLSGSALLDKLYITPATTLPSGEGAPAGNCDGSTIIVGIDDDGANQMHEVSVFPNPGSDLITIRFAEAMPGSYQCSLATPEGKIVRVFPIQKTAQQVSLDLKGIAPGVYILQMVNKEKSITRKIEKL